MNKICVFCKDPAVISPDEIIISVVELSHRTERLSIILNKKINLCQKCTLKHLENAIIDLHDKVVGKL